MEVFNGTGRRKTSVARVYIQPGEGSIKINNCSLEDYFKSEIHRITIKKAFTVVDAEKQYDVVVNVSGGGNTGQAEAIRLGVARTLVKINEENRSALKKEGMLTRDARTVERKKYGRSKARKRFQFSKR